MDKLKKLLEYAKPLGWKCRICEAYQEWYVEFRKEIPNDHLKLEIYFEEADPVPTFLDGLEEYYQNFDLEECAVMSEKNGLRMNPEEGLAIDYMLKDLYQTLSSAAEKIQKGSEEEEGNCDYPFPIGEIIPGDDGSYEIHRAPTSNGMAYKNWEAFYEHPDEPCYVAELSNKVYTRKDFLELAEGEADVAEAVFKMASWQSPCTVLDELFREDEVKKCNTCDRLYLTHGESTCRCPHCMDDTVKKVCTVSETDARKIRGLLTAICFDIGMKTTPANAGDSLEAFHVIHGALHHCHGKRDRLIQELKTYEGDEGVKTAIRSYMENRFGITLDDKRGEE